MSESPWTLSFMRIMALTRAYAGLYKDIHYCQDSKWFPWQRSINNAWFQLKRPELAMAKAQLELELALYRINFCCDECRYYGREKHQ